MFGDDLLRTAAADSWERVAMPLPGDHPFRDSVSDEHDYPYSERIENDKGNPVYRKVMFDQGEARNEVLGSLVHRAIGANAARVVRDKKDPRVVLVEMNENSFNPRGGPSQYKDDRGFPYWRYAETLTPKGALTGLGDLLTRERDAFTNNNRAVLPNGDPYRYDFARTHHSPEVQENVLGEPDHWSHDVNSGAAHHFMPGSRHEPLKANPLHPDKDVPRIAEALSRLRPDYEAEGVPEWHDELMRRWREVASHASGIESVLEKAGVTLPHEQAIQWRVAMPHEAAFNSDAERLTHEETPDWKDVPEEDRRKAIRDWEKAHPKFELQNDYGNLPEGVLNYSAWPDRGGYRVVDHEWPSISPRFISEEDDKQHVFQPMVGMGRSSLSDEENPEWGGTLPGAKGDSWEMKYPEDSEYPFEHEDAPGWERRASANSDRIWYHGTPDERTWQAGTRGIHVGTRQAAKEALEATIGRPAEGEWDGTREYGSTPLVSTGTGFGAGIPEGQPLPPGHTRKYRRPGDNGYGGATYSNGDPVPMDARPNIFPVRIVGPMTNEPGSAHDDFRANGMMSAQLKRGRARRGYYYTNVGEDAGSISAVVPSAAHLERVLPQHEAATKKKPKPKKPRKPEEVWYDVHKHPTGVSGGMGRSPEHHLRNRGWQPREIHGAASSTIQYMNHEFPDFAISFGGASNTKPDHNFRVLYMGTNRNIPKVTRAYSVAEAMNKVEELHQMQSGHVVLPMTHGAAVHFGATNWDEHYDKIPDEIHRGLFAPQSHQVFSVPMNDEEIAHELIRAHQEEHYPHNRDWDEKFGTHWTASEELAQQFAKEHEREHGEDDQCEDHDEHPNATPVVFHAQRPARHEIEEDPRRLGWQNVYDFDDSEQEVPIKHNSPVRLTGVSWQVPTSFGGVWHRHDLKNPMVLRAEDRDSSDDPNDWNGPNPMEHEAAAVPHTVGNPPPVKKPRPFVDPNAPEKPVKAVTAPTYPLGKPKSQQSPIKQELENPAEAEKADLKQIPKTPAPTQDGVFKRPKKANLLALAAQDTWEV